VATAARAQAVLDITAPNTIAALIKQFETDLKDLGIDGHVKSCGPMVDVAVGRADGNNSYGAECVIIFGSKTKKMMICDDDMVGHFALNNEAYADGEYLAQFIQQNCYGG
jgi:hypothetical protein